LSRDTVSHFHLLNDPLVFNPPIRISLFCQFMGLKLTMQKSFFYGAVVLLFSIYLPAAHAYVGLCCGKCGGNMPLNIMGAGVPETKEFRFKISPMFMSMDGLADGGDSIKADSLLGMPMMMGEPTGKFMAVPTSMDMQMLNFTAGYSFSDDFFGAVMLMAKDNSMDMKFSSMMQGTTGKSGFTMKSSGIADTMLMGKYRLFTDDPLIPTHQASLMFGLSLPTGSIDEKNTKHPLVTRQSELLPYAMQLGSGTFDPTLGIVYSASRSPYWWGINAMYTARLHNNDRDYRLGNEFRFDLYGMFQFRHNLVAQVQLNGSHWSTIRGEMDESKTGVAGHATKNDPNSPFMTPLWETGNYGGRKLLATAGLQWQPAPLHIIELNVGAPIYQHLNGPQLEEKYRVMLTWYREIPTKASIRHTKHKTKESRLGF